MRNRYIKNAVPRFLPKREEFLAIKWFVILVYLPPPSLLIIDQYFLLFDFNFIQVTINPPLAYSEGIRSRNFQGFLQGVAEQCLSYF